MNEIRKKCVITGGSRGIGLATAEALAGWGCDILLVSKNPETLEKAAAGLRKKFPEAEVLTQSVDIRSKEDLQDLAEYCKSTWGSLDILINNAGTFTPGSILSEPDGSLEFMMETNAYSAYYLTRYLYPLIQKSKAGHIVNVVSIAAIKAYPNGGSYGISKYAMLGFSKNLREELKPEGIKVTSILPGATWTDSWIGSGVDRERIMEVDDIADAILTAVKLGKRAVIEEIIVRPQLGDL